MNFFNRTFGGIIILFVLILITCLGRVALGIGVGIFSYIALYEMKRALANINIHLPMKLMYFTNGLIMLAAYFNNSDLYMASLIVSIICLFMYIIFRSSYSLNDGFAAAFVLLYVSFFMSHILRIKDVSYVWILYITAWGSDTFAYLVGSLIGKRKLTIISHISPNKTIEGSLGGVLGATVLNVIYLKVFALDAHLHHLIIFTIIAAILSQIGDLIASYIKRQTGIKDFGNLIPGHGGILDRFDSILFIAPIIYLLSQL